MHIFPFRNYKKMIFIKEQCQGPTYGFRWLLLFCIPLLYRPLAKEYTSSATFTPSEFHELFLSAAAAKSPQPCRTLWPHRRQPTRFPHPWDSPGKNTGVGCHFLLQCMKGKSESEVAQSCPTLRDPMDHSSPGSSIHGIFQARVLEWGAIAFSMFLSKKPIFKLLIFFFF